jgi:hypothetical protein
MIKKYTYRLLLIKHLMAKRHGELCAKEAADQIGN